MTTATSKGTFSFKWSEPAEEVYVTGSFDNWTKSEKLTKTADGTHVGVVTVPVEKITYKYVVDGTWTTDPKQRVEQDASGNDNNYLLVEDINPTEEPILSVPTPIPDTSDETVTPFIQSSGGESSTAALAAEVPLEPKKEKAKEPEPEPDTVVALPVIASEPTATISSVGPESTTAALAAEVPLEVAAKQEPIVPEATEAVVAPEDLPTPDPRTVPGSFLPDTIEEKDEADQVVSINPLPASETAGNPIHLEPNEPVPPHTASITDNVKLDKESYEKADASNLGVGATASAALAAVTGAISSAVGTTSETVKNLIPESVLPIASKPEAEDHSTATTGVVPPVVVESQEKAGVEPEASGNPVAVEAKKEVEDEIVETIHKAAPEPTGEFPRADVPEVVRESQAEAGAPLEASASPVAVEAKKEFEAELKTEVKPVEPIAEEPVASPSETPAVPAVVTASIEQAGVSAEAAANPVAVEAKAIVEEAITKGETKPETLEAPKAEEPSAAEKVAETAEKVVDKVVPETEATEAHKTEVTEAPKTEAPEAPKTEAPEPPKTEAEAPKTEVKNGEASADAAKDKDVKKKRRVSAFFHKIAQKLK